MESCPKCDKEFDGLTGRKIHHKRVHGESLAGTVVNCTICGEEFRQDATKAEEQENHLCSDDCLAEFRSQINSGEDGPAWKGGDVTKTCEWCGGEYNCRQSDKDSRRFCSTDCVDEWKSEKYSGEGHWNWQGGKVKQYSNGYQKMRQQVRKRDKNCQNCGEDGSDSILDVHHLIPVRFFEEQEGLSAKDAHKPGNGVLLCRSCHQKLHKSIRSDGQPDELTDSFFEGWLFYGPQRHENASR